MSRLELHKFFPGDMIRVSRSAYMAVTNVLACDDPPYYCYCTCSHICSSRCDARIDPRSIVDAYTSSSLFPRTGQEAALPHVGMSVFHVGQLEHRTLMRVLSIYSHDDHGGQLYAGLRAQRDDLKWMRFDTQYVNLAVPPSAALASRVREPIPDADEVLGRGVIARTWNSKGVVW